MPMRIYDPKLVAAAFGEVRLTGFAEGTFIKATRNKDTFTAKIGAQGEGCRVKNNDRSGRIEVTVMQSSPVNDMLSAIAMQDEIANTGVRDFQLKDLLGSTMVHAEHAWIVKPPDDEFGTEAGTRTWVFETENMTKWTGGSLAT